MLSFDAYIMRWTNSFAGKSSAFDWLVQLIASNAFVKGAPVAVVFLFLWHLSDSEIRKSRAMLIALLVATLVSITAGRIAATILPFRSRPLHSEDLTLQLPVSVRPETLDGWSSFPSDHAVLYATLVIGFWMVNRWAGILMAIHAVIVVAFSRIYLTLHYPTDIFGGAVVGFAISILLIPVLSKAVNKSNLLELVDKNPQYSYPFLFLFLMQISTMFTSARELAKAFVSFVT